jgi:hypothetical protein
MMLTFGQFGTAQIERGQRENQTPTHAPKHNNGLSTSPRPLPVICWDWTNTGRWNKKLI